MKSENGAVAGWKNKALKYKISPSEYSLVSGQSLTSLFEKQLRKLPAPQIFSEKWIFDNEDWFKLYGIV